MNGQTVWRAGVAAGAVLLAACAPAVRSQRDETVPVPQGATWAWAAPDTARRENPDSGARPETRQPPGRRAWAGPDGGDETGAVAIPRQRLRRAVEAAMLAHHFARTADPASADFLLSVTLGEGGRRPAMMGGPPPVAVSIGVGIRGGRGWRGPWGYPYGAWMPFGWYQPWGFGYYGYPLWGYATIPAWGYGPPMAYGPSAPRVVRPSGTRSCPPGR